MEMGREKNEEGKKQVGMRCGCGGCETSRKDTSILQTNCGEGIKKGDMK